MALPITARITEVEPLATRLPASQVLAGDIVFDVYGGQHPVDRVVQFRHVVRIVRDDGWPITLGRTEEITVIPRPRGRF